MPPSTMSIPACSFRLMPIRESGRSQAKHSDHGLRHARHGRHEQEGLRRGGDRTCRRRSTQSKGNPEAVLYLRLSVAQDKLQQYPQALDSANKAVQYAKDGSAAQNLAKQQQARLQKLMAAEAAGSSAPAGGANASSQLRRQASRRLRHRPPTRRIKLDCCAGNSIRPAGGLVEIAKNTMKSVAPTPALWKKRSDTSSTPPSFWSRRSRTPPMPAKPSRRTRPRARLPWNPTTSRWSFWAMPCCRLW